MGPYILSLFAGVLVGIIYAVLRVRSPAPPLIALIGFLGILVGENFFPVVKTKLFSKDRQREEQKTDAR